MSIRGSPSCIASRACQSPIRTNGAVTPPHSAPVFPMPPGNPAVSFTSHSASAPEASSRVCVTVGAQWPILNRFDMLRRRSVRVETVVKSPTTVSGIVSEGTGAVFVELVLPIAAPFLDKPQNWRPRAYARSR